MDLRELVGTNFARLRKKQGLTQEQVAELAGRSQQYISNLERGLCNPTIDTLQRIARAIGVSPIALFVPVRKSKK